MIARFEIGKVYACRSTCDYDCIFSARVVARTEKTVTFDEDGRRYTRRPHLWRDVESVYPHGQFSMCPVFSADRTLEQVINPPTRAQQEKTTMKNETKKPAPVKGAEIAAKAAAIAKAKAAFAQPAKPAAKPTPTKAPAPAPAKPADNGKPTVEEVVKARAAKIGIDPRKVVVATVEAPKVKPADKPKPEAPKPEATKPPQAPAKPAAPSDEETGRAWRDMANRHAVEMAALGVAVSPPKGVPCLRFVSGLYVPVAKAADYRATVDRHREERAKMRDVPATASGVYREELRAFKGDEIAALYELGLPHIADKAGIAVPVIRGNRALAEAWRSALEDVAPGKVSQIVTVRALGKPKLTAEAKPATAPADKAQKPAAPQKAPPKPATPATPAAGKSTAAQAAKPPQAAQRPADEKPKGLGMVAKIEAKADKPAKAAKPKR